VVLKLNETHCVVVYPEDDNLLVRKIHTIMTDTETLLVAAKELFQK